MELSRRALLRGLTAGTGAGAMTLGFDRIFDKSEASRALTDDDVDMLIAVAEIIYPPESSPESFVPQYTDTLWDRRKREMARVLNELNLYTKARYGESFATSPRQTREVIFQHLGIDRTYGHPNGTFPERLRFHVINQLLLGFFSTPVGSRLVGVTNPVGHPGDYRAYRQAPHNKPSPPETHHQLQEM